MEGNETTLWKKFWRVWCPDKPGNYWITVKICGKSKVFLTSLGEQIMTKLKACPFCNGPAELDKHEYSDMHEIVYKGITPEFATGPLAMELVENNHIFIADVKCTKCRLVGKTGFSKVRQKSIDEAIEYWNTRYGKKPKQ